MTQNERQILNDILAIIKQNLTPQRIWFFGSRVKGKAKPSSDFDFAVETNIKDQSTRWKVQDLIDAVRELYKVDIVYFDQIEEDFKKIILSTGKVVYERGN